MSDENPPSEDSKEKSQGLTSTTVARLRGLWRRFWYVPAFLGLVVLQILGTAAYRWAFPPKTIENTHEVSMGEFGFDSDSVTRSTISQVYFVLHISLIPELDQPARYLLKHHRYLLQQNVEELLRQATPGDFEDPSLAELKRQIQATINQTVSRRIVAEVIITDFTIKRSEPPEVHTVDSEPSSRPDAPWQEATPPTS